ncbi:MAG: aminotransferase class I/II-fold pyridoxal phosphate-dependent enzyme, partial [Clostridia bacterium]|nr:aminotransferase class I/II-fold pyridoxal phosphate-dependent enzyme [Clostridia bacterium]
YIIADKRLIDDLKKVKNSFHPYNVNSISALLAEAAIKDDDYFQSSVKLVIEGRKRLSDGLRKLSFNVLPSSANFVLARHDCVSGERLYSLLKANGILVRHFNDKRIEDYVRITVGTEEENEEFLRVTEKMLLENSK